MASLIDRWIERTADDAVRAHIQSPAFRGMVAKHVRWAVQGYAPGFGPKQREAFTETVAARIHDKARDPVYLFGYRVWRKRPPLEWCAKTAEEIVTNFLASENIEFGDPDFWWEDGHDIADEEMDNWEACP